MQFLGSNRSGGSGLDVLWSIDAIRTGAIDISPLLVGSCSQGYGGLSLQS